MTQDQIQSLLSRTTLELKDTDWVTAAKQDLTRGQPLYISLLC